MMRLVVVFAFFCFGSLYAEDKTIDTKKDAGGAKAQIERILAMADIQINGKRPWDIQVHNDQFYERVLSKGSLGLGESYMDSWWDCHALDVCLFKILRADLDKKVKPNWNMAWAYLRAVFLNLQDKVRCKKVIETHYELGNNLYKNMLGSTMAYSCGYWKEAKDLDQAQLAKFDLICRKLELKKGMRLLDIGCGWGGFVQYAAKNYGVECVGITLSPKQAEYAKEVCRGLPVEIRVQDYRDINEQFDRVLSIGMFEHVGKKNYRNYMEIVHRLLKPNGMSLLHTIGNNKTNYTTDPWISTYIFPNSHLPSIKQIAGAIEGLFVMEDWHNFGAYYDKTLMAWFQNFNQSWPMLKAEYGDRFYRMWKFYLLSCAGAFRARKIQLWQVVLSKDGILGGYVRPE
jgi:cyclopropane-fatty-acyl-phospholipid synthase